MPQGTVLLDFGAFPGTTDVTVAVTGQAAILAGSLAEAWIFPVATVDHNADEHWVDPPDVFAGNIVAAVGFTIYGRIRSYVNIDDGLPPRTPGVILNSPTLYGKWTVAWAWN